MKKLPIAEIILVILGSILYFAANLQRVAIPGAMFNILQQDLHTTAHNVAGLGSYFMYVYAIGQLIIGVLIARYGGFRVITIGSVIFFIGCLLFPFADTLPVLYLARALTGFGSATFYLSLINETRKIVSEKNFGVVLSLILFIGYLGGIIANAPLLFAVKKIDLHLNYLGCETIPWREAFLAIGIISLIVSLAFILIKCSIPKRPVDESVHFDLELFKATFQNKKNYALFAFACLNYGLYYVVQTVWGKKFLEDFFKIPEMQAAVILSIMGTMYAIAGSVFAFLSKVFLSRRTVFLKISAFNTFFVFVILLIFTCFNIKTPLAGAFATCFFCTISFGASLSPLLVPLLHDYNGPKVANTSIGVMTAGFFFVVAILGSISGFFLDTFQTNSYLAIYIMMTLTALISLICVFQIPESQKTLRYINYVHYLKDHQSHWHDKYEHDIYTNM